MAGTRPFLTARWEHVVIATFAAPEHLVRGALDPALEPDRWQGAVHVSVVAVNFRDVRVHGLAVPGFSRFPVVNLRTYVRRGPTRGVVFLREVVPSVLVAAVARWVYREPFRALPIRTHSQSVGGDVAVSRRFGPRLAFRLDVVASGARPPAAPGTADHHFAERQVGFRATRRGLTRFRVERDPWPLREVVGWDCDVDFAALYGAPWGALNGQAPMSVIYSEGTEVCVLPPEPAS